METSTRTAETYRREIPRGATSEATKGTVRAITKTVLEPTFSDEVTALTAIQDLHPHLICDEKGEPILDNKGRRQFEYTTIPYTDPKPFQDLTARPVVVFEKVLESSSRLSRVLNRLVPRRT